MGKSSENTPDITQKKYICTALLAHVDAGKTTLAESILYESGILRETGRVDHGDAFLDTYSLERERGITIFSKQAIFSLGDTQVTLLDTPGHVDFSTEMERTLQVLDCAILVISGAAGVQGHTLTLWKLLKEYKIPTFLFINKMDQPGTDKDALLTNLQHRLDMNCLDFTGDLMAEEMQENLAMGDEALMERYLEGEIIHDNDIARLIRERKIFPCFFGSALKDEGVDHLLEGISRFVEMPNSPEEFGARVFKINRDAQGNRLTHMKITGGSLKVKSSMGENGDKVDQIRLYSGDRFVLANEVTAGQICAVTGLKETRIGEGLGFEENFPQPILEAVLDYQIILPEGCDPHTILPKLRQLQEEDPQLKIRWEENLEEIYASVMGEVQIEILKSVIAERFGVEVAFGEGHIVYRETICNQVEGVGHFEPLRHYAEVHLLMEPMPRGSGLSIASQVSEDKLDLNWQRLILTHVLEREHPGVLLGGSITDLRITLVNGKAHLKHTEGGDFRQATYRAIRQGLMQAKCQLLEPWYHFRLEIPQDTVGRAMSDIQRMGGSFESPRIEGDMAILEGRAPVAGMRSYQSELMAYSRGLGSLSCMMDGYDVCHNSEEVLTASAYDPDLDAENPSGSVFCSHGAGYYVPWNEVADHMHLEGYFQKRDQEEEEVYKGNFKSEFEERKYGAAELEEIFQRTYGQTKRERYPYQETVRKYSDTEAKPYKPKKKKKELEEYLLVDGYNIIFAWEDLSQLAKTNIDGARGKLIDIMCDYQGWRQCTLILVFDAYRPEGHKEEIVKYHNIHVVYTKEAETADQFIEKTVHKMRPQYEVTVATSDGLEQIIIRGEGAHLISAREFREEIAYSRKMALEALEEQKTESGKAYLLDHASEELSRELEKIRLGDSDEK